LTVTTTESAPVMISVLLLRFAGPLTVKVTASPEVAVAETVKGLTP
jgi:hypothetical protein